MRASVDVSEAWIQGRNGVFDLCRIVIFGDEFGLYIDGISKHRKIAINGGMGNISPEEMDQLVVAYIKARGEKFTGNMEIDLAKDSQEI